MACPGRGGVSRAPFRPMNPGRLTMSFGSCTIESMKLDRPVFVRFAKATVKVLQKRAKQEGRTLSDIVRRIVVDALAHETIAKIQQDRITVVQQDRMTEFINEKLDEAQKKGQPHERLAG